MCCQRWPPARYGVWPTQGLLEEPTSTSTSTVGGVSVNTHGAKQMAQGTEQIVRARDLSGLRVYNASDESLGKIEDLVIDPRAGKIRYAVLSFGGLLGMGDKYFAIPWDKLSFVSKGQTSAGTLKEDHVVLDIPKDALKNRRASTRIVGPILPTGCGAIPSNSTMEPAERHAGNGTRADKRL